MSNEESGTPARRWRVWLGLGLALIAALPACGERGVQPPVVARSKSAAELRAAGLDSLPRRIQAALTEQAAALIAGDERGFLAAAEPGSPAVAVLRQQFHSLRALKVAIWVPEITEEPEQDAGELKVGVTVNHCFVVAACEPAPALFETRWVDRDGTVRIVAVQASQRGGPRPWEVSALRAAVGQRTVVATTPAQRGQLTVLSREAEKAAAVADKYAVGGTKPERYLIFYAGDAEWKRWYGGAPSAWAAGFAAPTGMGPHHVVIKAKGLHATVLDDVLRHEMTHVSSLPFDGGYTQSKWWLVEGIAEHASLAGQPLGRYNDLPAVRKLVQGGWKGPLPESAPPAKATRDQAGGAYGVSLLAVHRLVERFGMAKMLAFFKAAVHDDKALESASMEQFGQPWKAVHADCVSYVRNFR
ncbi:hypothetical protein [Phytohabitans rumicis]|uniref:Peptidase MA-like domain-containing protein n=1 Tax=Phytohabitans rumicis TaxID=1076125 RepID=A0A6V8LIZ9_9ACTN|nr:hypothetical protein [Phytohabitans rumicis]GFJ95530.1 hypothetical protein Prum_091720 [Phytohabitans rumicis]